MPISTSITSVGKDITVLLDDTLSPKAQSRAVAEFAQEKLAEAEDQNRRALGRTPDHKTIVDGRLDASLESVKPDGVIVFEFDLLTDLFVWIKEQLVTHSPHRSGTYATSHRFFADGIEADPARPPLASDEWVFAPSDLPYARKIERGLSRRAPDGVYQVVAVLAARRFGNQARIQFSYRTIGTERQPAIVIVPR